MCRRRYMQQAVSPVIDGEMPLRKAGCIYGGKHNTLLYG